MTDALPSPRVKRMALSAIQEKEPSATRKDYKYGSRLEKGGANEEG